MSTSVGPVPSPSVRTTTSPWSRVYGLGSVYAKTLRDSRLAILIVGGLLGARCCPAASPSARRTRRSNRAPTWQTVANLPPALTGVTATPSRR